MTFIGINLICIREHGINMLSLFLPSGASTGLALLLVPIELVSYIFRLISLAVRLFANMMAGHKLLKVIAGFVWTMMRGCIISFPLSPFICFRIVDGFRTWCSSIIQACVFTILTCIYLNDSIHLH